VLKVKADGQGKEVTVVGSKGKIGDAKTVKIGDIDYTIFYGSKAYELPFKIKLNDFIAEIPWDGEKLLFFESKVTIQDSSRIFDARIYMNNIWITKDIVSFNLHLILTKGNSTICKS
jgi:hypothetical protein